MKINFFRRNEIEIYRREIGSLHWPATNFWNKEAVLLEKVSFREKPVQTLIEELTDDERLQVFQFLLKINLNLLKFSHFF